MVSSTQRFIAALFVVTLSACGGGGGSGDSDGEETLNGVGNGSGTDLVVPATEDENDSGNDLVEPDTGNGPAIPFVGSGDSISGSLNTGEIDTFQVPAGSQVVLRSDTGDSFITVYETPELLADDLVCFDRFSFQEDTCSGESAGEFQYAAVRSDEPGDYTLSVTNDCSVGSVNQWVYRSMQDYYLFADQVPTLNPLDYDSTSELVRDLRFNELDPFSFIRDAEANQNAQQGVSLDFGYIWRRDSEGDLRILNIYEDSPFGRNDVKRGDIFHSLGGIIDSELTNEQFSDFIGTDDDPKLAEWTFEDGETGDLKTFVAAMAEYTVNTVSQTTTITHPSYDGRIGYIVFTNFLSGSPEELDEAINLLAEANVTDLVLDLRYNTGGLVSVAERLAAQLSGNRLTGQVLKERRFNDTYRDLDSESRFEEASPTLDLSRITVITSDNTASASELVINSLRPYMEVITVGERSLGKVLISNAREFCGMALNAMNSENVNATEMSAAGGIEATCFAQDDFTRNYGVTESGVVEGMLESALNNVVFGTCDVAPIAAVASRNSLETTTEGWERTGEVEVLGSMEDRKPQSTDF